MPKKNFRWEYVLLATILTVGVLSLTYFSYETLGVKKPLIKAVTKDPDVLTADVSEENGKTILSIQLRKVEDLSKTYKRIQDLSQKYVAKDNLEIRIQDKRDRELETAYLKIHYYLQEAAARGDYGAMIDSSRKVLDGSGLQWKILVDQGNIFVQLDSGASYLYEVIPALWSKGGSGA